MKLSNIVLGAIMFASICAQADLKSEFSQAEGIAQSRISSVRSVQEQQAVEKVRRHEAEVRKGRVIEITRFLKVKGLDTEFMSLQFGGLELCIVAGCPSTETYFAKSGNIVCKVQYKFSDTSDRREILHSCYDSANPQPTENDLHNRLEISSK